MKAADLLANLKTVVESYLAVTGTETPAADASLNILGVITSPAFTEFRAVLGDFLSQTKEEDIAEAAAELTARREAIRAGRTLRELSDEDLMAYAALGDLRHIMTAEHLRVSMNHASLEDFIRVVVPIVKELAPIALMLL